MATTTANTAPAAQHQYPRLENTVACVPIVYGSIAFTLATNTKKQPAAGDDTHSWTLYLRGPNNEDLSKCIEKAVFHLHPSFAKPVRELTSTPVSFIKGRRVRKEQAACGYSVLFVRSRMMIHAISHTYQNLLLFSP